MAPMYNMTIALERESMDDDCMHATARPRISVCTSPLLVATVELCGRFVLELLRRCVFVDAACKTSDKDSRCESDKRNRQCAAERTNTQNLYQLIYLHNKSNSLARNDNPT